MQVLEVEELVVEPEAEVQGQIVGFRRGKYR